MVIKGRIVEFLSLDRNSNYAEFIFRSDFDKACPRFNALCVGYVPDVVPGVPMKIEFPVRDVREIATIDRCDQRNNNFVNAEARKCLRNHIVYSCIDYKDEDYARSLLLRVKGIASKTADKIISLIDGNLHYLVNKWDDEEFWKQIRGAKRFRNILKEFVGNLLIADTLFQKYGRYGIGYSRIDLLTHLYGENTEKALRNNPYIILTKLDLPFQVADHLAKDLGFEYLDERRVKAMIYYVLKQNESNGNTCMSQGDFYAACAQLHEVSAWKDYVVSPYYILAIITSTDYINYENGYIGFISTLRKEADIAYQIQRLNNCNTELHTADAVFDEISGNYNEDQIAFLRAFDKNSVTLLLGRGGTGKTHTICGAIDLFKRRYPDQKIKLCAPTARAAGVLKECTGYEASTIHVLLGIRPHNAVDETDINELDAKLIVVDEMSMVDTELMYYLLKAVKTGAKLILSGDPDQLESVGSGAVLIDLICSDMLPKVQLHKIMRQSEGSAVIENCDRILAGNACLIQNNYFHIHQCRTEQEALELIKQCRSEDKRKIQILTTSTKGIAGTMAINSMFEDGGEYISLPHGHFRVGDKVIFIKNNYKDGYFNGEIGYVKSILPCLRIVKQGEKKAMEIAYKNYGDIEHADAITIHKSQGSEYQKVYIILTEKPVSMLTRNMVNTAISRAKQQVELIVIGNALRVSASNRFKRDRTTMLCKLLVDSKETLDSRS